MNICQKTEYVNIASDVAKPKLRISYNVKKGDSKPGLTTPRSRSARLCSTLYQRNRMISPSPKNWMASSYFERKYLG